MTKQEFLNDLQKIYDFLNEQKTKTNELIKFLEKEEFEKLSLINDFAKVLGLEITNDLRFALVTRIVNLRDDSLVQVLKKLEKTEQEIISYQEKAYNFVKEYWHDIHTKFVDFIIQNNLLTPSIFSDIRQSLPSRIVSG